MTDRTCSVDGCDAAFLARGYCSKHYQRWRARGSVEDRAPQTADGLCMFGECDKPVWARGWCTTHYSRWHRHGTLDDVRAWVNAPPDTKWCPQCRAYRSTQDFSICRWTSSGLQSWCKQCMEPMSRKRRARLHEAESERYTAIEIAERDGWRCGICGRRIGKSYRHPHPRSLSIDHIVPISKGGDDVKSNVQAAHLRCNLSKHTGGTDQLRLIG